MTRKMMDFFGRHFGFDSTRCRKPPFLWSVGPVVSMELLKEEAKLPVIAISVVLYINFNDVSWSIIVN